MSANVQRSIVNKSLCDNLITCTIAGATDVYCAAPGISPSVGCGWVVLGNNLGLTDFDPLSVNWDVPSGWRLSGDDGGQIMSLAGGYLLCILFGVFFSVVTIGLTWLETKFGGVVITSEHFNTAGRDVKTGLTAAVIVSQWTWAATLLQSSNVAWSFGLSGPFWYAAGATVQVLLFGVLAIEVKRKAPNAHTFLEMVDARWGKCAHITFLYFALATNTIVSAMLLLGGSAVMLAASGVPIPASGALIPLGTLFYTQVGGLKATFLASYIHTAIIFIGLVIMILAVYMIPTDCSETYSATCNSLGSAAVVWERLQFNVNLPKDVTTDFKVNIAATDTAGSSGVGAACTTVNETCVIRNKHQGPHCGNAGGSYVTMVSIDGLMFGIINTVGNFGTVFVDQSYWQSAIAAHPGSAHRGYLFGGLVWFTIPFALATSTGLAGNALNVDLQGNDAGAGLVPPASATVLLGPFGGYMIIIMLLMAITSTGSAEMIAVSSLLTYDVYRKYFNPDAPGKRILLVSRIGVAFWALMMFVVNIILWQIGVATDGVVNLGWVYNFMGIMIGCAVLPVSFLLLWSQCSALGASAGALLGNIFALAVWIIHASQLCGQWSAAEFDKSGCEASQCLWRGVSAKTLGSLPSQLSGNLTSILSAGLVCAVLSCIRPQNYDFAEMNKNIRLVEDAKVLGTDDAKNSPEFLTHALNWITKYGVGGTVLILVLWPIAVIPWGVFSKSTYMIWSSVAVMWGLLAASYIISAPLVENRKTIMNVLTWTVPEPKSVGGKPLETATA